MSNQSNPMTVRRTMSGRWASSSSTLSLAGTHGSKLVPETKPSQLTSATTTFCKPFCQCLTNSTKSSRLSSVSTPRSASPSQNWHGESRHARPSQHSLAYRPLYRLPQSHHPLARASSTTARSKRSIFATWPEGPGPPIRLEMKKRIALFSSFWPKSRWKTRANAGHRPFPSLNPPFSLFIPLTHERANKQRKAFIPPRLRFPETGPQPWKIISARYACFSRIPNYSFLYPLILFFYILPSCIPSRTREQALSPFSFCFSCCLCL